MDKIRMAIEEGVREMEDMPMGSRAHIEVDINGNVWRTGALTGGQSISSWEGESFIVAEIEAGTLEDIWWDYYNYSKEEIEDGREEIISELCYTEMDKIYQWLEY